MCIYDLSFADDDDDRAYELYTIMTMTNKKIQCLCLVVYYHDVDHRPPVLNHFPSFLISSSYYYYSISFLLLNLGYDDDDDDGEEYFFPVSNHFYDSDDVDDDGGVDLYNLRGHFYVHGGKLVLVVLSIFPPLLLIPLLIPISL